MNRRTFIETLGVTLGGAAVAGTLGEILDAKLAAKPLHAKDVTEVPINLQDNPELANVGGTYHLEYDDLSRDILVVHVAKDQFVGVDIKCTHRACEVSYNPDEKNLYCPCHGSKFDVYGHVLVGPATVPLQYYHAELKGDEVMVTVFGPDDKVPATCIAPPMDTTSHVPVDSSQNK
ncbi:MAG TPA: Rieske 2Fe-2S domain-containing protein [Candidatus Kapabacteria bacterium]